MINPNKHYGNRRTVLVVEDEPLIRLMIADELRDAGLVVVEANCAADALDYIHSKKDVHFVFSDVRMPGDMDGFALARYITERFPEINVVLTSGHTGNDQPPPVQLVPKPYRLSAVRAMIVQALRGGESSDA